MPIERKNSFHLMLSDDELELLHLLAEREGLNASDYLRTTLRRLAGPPPHLASAVLISDALRSKQWSDVFGAKAAGAPRAKRKKTVR